MEGKPRDRSMGLVLASVPVQALMMVGTIGLLMGGASTSHVQTVQVVPANGSYSRIIMVPIEACPLGGQPDTSGVPSPVLPPDAIAPPAASAIACPNPAFYYVQHPSANLT